MKNVFMHINFAKNFVFSYLIIYNKKLRIIYVSVLYLHTCDKTH